jgi:hypothetical protein
MGRKRGGVRGRGGGELREGRKRGGRIKEGKKRGGGTGKEKGGRGGKGRGGRGRVGRGGCSLLKAGYTFPRLLFHTVVGFNDCHYVAGAH